MATLLAKKSGPQDNAVATDDEHHDQLASDPEVTAFPQGSSFGSTGFGGPNAFNTSGTTTFSVSTTSGFNSPTGFGANNNAGNFGSGNMATQAPPSLTAAGNNAAQGAEVLVANDNTDWINKKWRPAMGWVYMATCTADFVLFPVLWSLLQALTKGNVTMQWQPLTLQGAGLYHIAMGAVLGIAAYGRTKEKIEGKS
jgi:hypothetical protein